MLVKEPIQMAAAAIAMAGKLRHRLIHDRFDRERIKDLLNIVLETGAKLRLEGAGALEFPGDEDGGNAEEPTTALEVEPGRQLRKEPVTMDGHRARTRMYTRGEQGVSNGLEAGQFVRAKQGEEA